MTSGRKQHWEQVYTNKSPKEVSWYQTVASMSLALIQATGADKAKRIIDIGGGASVLVDNLYDLGFRNLAVLDISHAAIVYAQARLGAKAAAIEWIESDVTAFRAKHRFDLWHDRAVFHFLTEADDRRRYVEILNAALAPDGDVIIATFAVDGPTKCSGLDIVQYDASAICKVLGSAFQLQETRTETHVTPRGAEQKFACFRFKKSANNQAVT